MLWFLVVIACLFLAVKFRGFRYTILAVATILAVIIAVYMANKKQEEESSKRLVRADQLVFTDLTMGPESYGSSYRLTGRVRNTSPYSVFLIKAKVDISDCDAQQHCDVVGEKEENIRAYDSIPPGQVRDIDTSIYFDSGTRIRGHFQWNYQITEIRAR